MAAAAAVRLPNDEFATIEQLDMGRWHVSENGAEHRFLSGDFAVDFITRDQDDRVLGHYPTYERAMYAVLHKPLR